jgi:ribosome production factor 2
VHENEKNALFVTGRSVSATVKDWLKDIYALKAPNAVKLNRKNDILPFEDESKLEFLSLKNDCSVFMVGNHSKKRPNNIVMGRLYDFRVLDILEFGFDNFKPMHSFSGPAPGIGMRPCFVFCGEDFETKPEFKKVANIFLDFFRGRTTSMINLKGLEHVIVMTALEGVVYFRHYAVALQKSGSALPRVELQELGPSFDLRIRRTKFASEESWKEATKQHALIKPKSKKNIERDSLGQTLGNVHVGRQVRSWRSPADIFF